MYNNNINKQLNWVCFEIYETSIINEYQYSRFLSHFSHNIKLYSLEVLYVFGL